MAGKTNFICHLCDKRFNTFSALSMHRIRKHNIKKGRDFNFTCEESGCTFTTSRNKILMEHLLKRHHINIKIQKLNFQTMQDFYAWKATEEENSASHFILNSGTKVSKDEHVSYYCCYRSGHYTPKCPEESRKRALKAQGSSKINKNCTANIQVRENICTKHIKVEYCSTHYGHSEAIAEVSMANKANVVQDCHAERNTTEVSITGPMCDLQVLPVIGKENLQNIKQSAVSDVVLHQDDHISVDMVVDARRIIANKAVLLFKPRGELSDEFPSLLVDDFILIIQTNFQCIHYEAFGEKVICINATHKWKNYDLKLITILCADELDKGVPIMWALLSKDDVVMTTILFTILRKQSPNTVPKYVMSDDDPVYFSAFEQVYPNACTRKLLCIRHVLQSCGRAIKQHVPCNAQDDICQELSVIAHTQDPKEFLQLQKIFQKKLEAKQETRAFATYYNLTYGVRPTEWAAWARRNAMVNTNMYAETFRKLLKHDDGLQGQHEKLDGLINVLFKLESYFVKDRNYKVKEQIRKKIENINLRHHESLDMSEAEYEFEKGVGEDWRFVTKRYHVVKQTCPLSVCGLKCPACNICIHDYSCTCKDMSSKKTICKHIHFILQAAANNRSCEDLSSTAVHEENADVIGGDHDYYIKMQNATIPAEFHGTDTCHENSRDHSSVEKDFENIYNNIKVLFQSSNDEQLKKRVVARLKNHIVPMFTVSHSQNKKSAR